MPRRAATAGRRAREIERTRQDIVEAAARVFAVAGYHDATMQAIAKEAGFTAASLYTYFESKDEIHEALLLELRRTMLGVFEEHVPSGLTFEQRLELLVQRQLTVVASRRDALRVAFEIHPARRDEAPGAFLARLAAYLAEFGARQLRIPPDEAANLLFGLGHALILPWFICDAEPDPSRDAAHLVDVFLHGVARLDPA